MAKEYFNQFKKTWVDSSGKMNEEKFASDFIEKLDSINDGPKKLVFENECNRLAAEYDDNQAKIKAEQEGKLDDACTKLASVGLGHDWLSVSMMVDDDGTPLFRIPDYGFISVDEYLEPIKTEQEKIKAENKAKQVVTLLQAKRKRFEG